MLSITQFWIGSGLIFALLIWSGWAPFDRTTWLLEVFPVLLAWPLLWRTRQSYPLTSLLYLLILLHAAVLILGGAYTYARVPFGFWLMDWFALDRNPYDKIGHLMQGFVPVLVAREILIRGAYVRGKWMLQFLLICVVLAISASYELIEWVQPWHWGRALMSFWALRAMPGILRLIWVLPCLALSLR